jgi:hypothetical protein
VIQDNQQKEIEYLRSTAAIRERCQQIYALGLAGKLPHFRLNTDRIPFVVEYVLKNIRENYPDLEIPYHSRWRHFDVGGISRVNNLFAGIAALSPLETGRIKYELVITSVLLDAGAGREWSYREAPNNQIYSRSEGLAVASFNAYCQGAFSSQKPNRLLADAQGLGDFSDKKLQDYFQVSASNPMVGTNGRARLIQNLGAVVKSSPKYFGREGEARLGYFFDYLLNQSAQNKLSALAILAAVLDGFQAIWPGRIAIGSQNLGDVWEHRSISGKTPNDHKIPFHKLSQWLTYSLIEPLEAAGITVTNIDQMTGLPEYRNGGLLIDAGVLTPISPKTLTESLKPGDESIVEWRALTVHILDLLGKEITKKIGKTAQEFPLAKVLQGGTWSAGRKIALEKRPDGSPPITIDSDGTVF